MMATQHFCSDSPEIASDRVSKPHSKLICCFSIAFLWLLLPFLVFGVFGGTSTFTTGRAAKACQVPRAQISSGYTSDVSATFWDIDTVDNKCFGPSGEIITFIMYHP